MTSYDLILMLLQKIEKLQEEIHRYQDQESKN